MVLTFWSATLSNVANYHLRGHLVPHWCLGETGECSSKEVALAAKMHEQCRAVCEWSTFLAYFKPGERVKICQSTAGDDTQ